MITKSSRFSQALISKKSSQLSMFKSNIIETPKKRSYSLASLITQTSRPQKEKKLTPSSKKLLYNLAKREKSETKKVTKKLTKIEKKPKITLLTISDKIQKDIRIITNETSQMIKTLKDAKNEIENPNGNIFLGLNKTKTVTNFREKNNNFFFRTTSNQNFLKTKSQNIYSEGNRQTKEESNHFSIDSNEKSSVNSIYRARKKRFSFNLQALINKHKNFYVVPLQFLTSLSMKHLSEDYKHNFIKNRMNLLLDNIHFFRDEYLNNPLLHSSFINLNNELQINYNKDLELLCSLCLEIPKILLGDFYSSIDQFLYCKIPSTKEYSRRIYDNESEIFISNLKLLCEIITYIGSCKEVYELLVKKVEHLKISEHNFKLLEYYLNFSRYYSSSISSMAKGYIEKLQNDKEFLRKFEEETKLIPKSKPKPTDLLTRIHERSKPKEKDVIKKITRIEKALNLHKRTYDDDFQERKKKMEREEIINVKSMLHSNIITKLLKYVNIKTKEKIIAQRVVDRYRKKDD